MIEPFDERIERALHDEQLRSNLLEFQRGWRATRDRAVETIDFESLRTSLAQVKDTVIRDLPRYAQSFTATAEAAGALVYRAETAEDAVHCVAAIARQRSVTLAVKSKSMLSEEIDLNRGLADAGVRVVETDLGEWILQLAGERPSHIIAPAVHKNRRQVAELFESVTGESVSREDIAEQVGIARLTLRNEFLTGEMGITGANALIAETGTLMLVTNEGNAELVSLLPRIHVVVAGIEKILPTLSDAMTQLQLLAPSATGQQATSYVSFVTGPGVPEQELHIVLVDNGRMAMRSASGFDEALRCIRCGACSSVCPSYGVVGGHVFGYVYSGAIGLVNTPFHHGIENDVGPQSLCVSCNACQAVCPVDIPLPRQILDVRRWASEREGMRPLERAGLEIWSRPRLARAAARVGAMIQKPVKRGPFLEPPGMSKLTSWRRLPALAHRPFRDVWLDEARGPLPGPLGHKLEGARVAYFVQCLTDWLYPEMGLAVAEILRGLGATVVFPLAQHCCGLPALDAGARDPARRMARQTIRTLEKCPADYVLSGGTSCVVAMLHEYAHLFEGEPEWQVRAARQAKRVLDLTTFLDRIVQLESGSLASMGPTPATYHYFCQSFNVLGFREEPIRLLGDVCGLDLQPLPDQQVCCGFGGSVSFLRPEMCSHILERKLDNVEATGAGVLVTDNPGCIMQLRGGLAARGDRITVKHTAEVVAERLRALRPD